MKSSDSNNRLMFYWRSVNHAQRSYSTTPLLQIFWNSYVFCLSLLIFHSWKVSHKKEMP